MADGILNIDGFNWSLLKYSEQYLATLSDKTARARREVEKETFEKYHARLREWVETHGGRIWSTVGDCTLADGFASIDEAVAAATTIQRHLTDFNVFENHIETPLFVRIGVARGALPNIPIQERGETSLPELDEVGHLQKDCPPGRVRISRAVFEALRFGKHDFRPGLSLGLKPLSVGSMVWIDRMLTPDELEAIKALNQRQARSYPPIVIIGKDLIRLGFDDDLSDVREMLSHAFVVVGETRNQGDEARPVSHAGATSDSVGILEVLAVLQSSPDLAAGVDEWVDAADLATQMNIVVVGSPAVNLFAYAVNSVLPAGFEETNRWPMRIRVDRANEPIYFPPTFQHDAADRHYGLVLFDRSPISPAHKILWIAGISGMATQAAARFVRDLVASPTNALGSIGTNRPNLVVVRPKWQLGFRAEQYQGMWRVNEYEVVWAGHLYSAT